MTYPDFSARWLKSGGSEHANYGLFLQDLCDLLDVPRPEPKTDDPAQDAYVFERGVTFDDGAGKKSTGRIDLYKRGCFVLETKQGVTRLEEVSTPVNTASAEPRTSNLEPRTSNLEPRTSNLEPRTSNGVSWACPSKYYAAATPCAARPNGARW